MGCNNFVVVCGFYDWKRAIRTLLGMELGLSELDQCDYQWLRMNLASANQRKERLVFEPESSKRCTFLFQERPKLEDCS